MMNFPMPGTPSSLWHAAGWILSFIIKNICPIMPEVIQRSAVRTGFSPNDSTGKSTLLKLFMRFWQVQQGEVKISGKNADEINTTNLRNMESFVTQET
ncbi:MAG: ATP-binding cassette domain-containing protein, partial [Lentisphaeria bacterium]|nr:ATP-binding cassette domain-containing protein [Lentisphaeria bacterium]